MLPPKSPPISMGVGGGGVEGVGSLVTGVQINGLNYKLTAI